MRKVIVTASVVALTVLGTADASGYRPDPHDPRLYHCDRPVSVNDGGSVELVVTRVNCNLARDVVKRHFRGNPTRFWKCTAPIFQGKCKSKLGRKPEIIRWYPNEDPARMVPDPRLPDSASG